jgi:hypothetical protein
MSNKLLIKTLALVVIFGSAAFMSGCATIIHSGPRAIPVASTPPGAKVSIYDRDNKLVLTNTTPFVAQLNTKYAYFKAQSYRLVFEMPGHASTEVRLDSTLSGWYWGNFAFGGLLGMLVVDPLTGAMYNLTPEKVETPLTASQSKLIRDGGGVLVVLLSQATDDERASMVRIN